MVVWKRIWSLSGDCHGLTSAVFPCLTVSASASVRERQAGRGRARTSNAAPLNKRPADKLLPFLQASLDVYLFGRLLTLAKPPVSRYVRCMAGEQDEPDGVRAVDAAEVAGRPMKLFDFVMVAFVVILLLSNVIGAGKRAVIDLPFVGPWPFGAGILFFPLSYVLGDVLTEVYGYARARRCIWAGFAAMLFMVAMSLIVVALPPDAGWTGQAAYEAVFGQVPRIVFASIAAFWVGEFANSVVLARMKVWTRGRMLWTRTIGSTIVGQGFDSLIFYPLAFYGVTGWPVGTLGKIMLTQFILKVSWEVLLTPATYAIVGWLKRTEGLDVYDRSTDLTPFALRT